MQLYPMGQAKMALSMKICAVNTYFLMSELTFIVQAID